MLNKTRGFVGKPGQEDSPVDIVIMTHEAVEVDVQKALKEMEFIVENSEY